jgi:hypothetical protein
MGRLGILIREDVHIFQVDYQHIQMPAIPPSGKISAEASGNGMSANASIRAPAMLSAFRCVSASLMGSCLA